MVVSWFLVHLSGAAVMGMQQNSSFFNVHVFGICLIDDFFHCEVFQTSGEVSFVLCVRTLKLSQ
jgi:hypothetical protein